MADQCWYGHAQARSRRNQCFRNTPGQITGIAYTGELDLCKHLDHADHGPEQAQERRNGRNGPEGVQETFQFMNDLTRLVLNAFLHDLATMFGIHQPAGQDPPQGRRPLQCLELAPVKLLFLDPPPQFVDGVLRRYPGRSERPEAL